MLESYRVGAVFTLLDEASPQLEKLSRSFTAMDEKLKATQRRLDRFGFGGGLGKLQGELEKATTSSGIAVDKIAANLERIVPAATKAFDSVRTNSAGLWTGMTEGADAASAGVIAAMGKIGAAVDGPLASVRALLGETNAAVERMAALNATTGAGAVERAATRLPSSGGVGRAGHAGGPHFGRVGTEIPGGHMSLGGGPALAGAGVIGFGIYEAAMMRDEIQKLMITGQVDPDKFGSTREQFAKLMQDAASTTGFSVKEVGEALAKSERALAGVDVGTKMNVTQALIPYAATEARLKGTGLAEALETMVGLSHMTGVFDTEGVKDLARKFSFVSLATNASLPSFEKTLSYSMPVLRTGMGMNPDTVMALTAAAQNAGITSTKSGTWLRSFFQASEPSVGGDDKATQHNNYLRGMGLLDDKNMPTWKVTGADGKTDWNASVVKEGAIIRDHLAGVPIDERMGTVKNIWGERGGAMASMLSMNTFMEQFSIIAQKIQNFKGGASAIEEYTKDNPAQKARETWRDFENVLMNIGDKALPTVNSALTALDDALKRLPADWEATKAMWGFRVNAVGNATGAAADKLKDGADVLGNIPGPLGAPFRDTSKPAFDPNAIPSSGFQPMAYVTEGARKASDSVEVLRDKTVVINGSFDGLGTGSRTLDGTFKILEATALGAARALATVAMSGGGSAGGGSGFMNASWGSGSPDLSAALRGGGGEGVGHMFSAAEREGNIRAYAAKLGIDPNVAMAVARSEGFGKFTGDHGTSFGDLQMHIGGGLGDFFRRATGKNPADPRNELELDRFALDQAKKGGWGPWHGAAAKHIYGRYGMDYHGPVPTVSAPRPRVTPGAPASGGHDVEAALHRALGQVAMSVNLTYDQKHQKTIAKFTTKHQAAAMRFPMDMGGPDGRAHYRSPGTPITDAA